MNIGRHIEALSLKDSSQRRDALACVLKSEQISFTFQDGNYHFSPKMSHISGQKCLLFSAHYDNYRDSYGANDNMAAVCILIDLCRELDSHKIYAEFVLTDHEESNHEGALSFCQTHDMKAYSGIINLDLCGYGDSIVYAVRGGKSAFRKFMNNKAQQVKYLPEGDDVVFRKFRVPVMSLAIVLKWDVQYLKALAAFGDGLLGRPPEFDMILSQMEVTSTMHCGSKDNPEFIDSQAMQKVHDYLIESMTMTSDTESFTLAKYLREVFRLS